LRPHEVQGGAARTHDVTITPALLVERTSRPIIFIIVGTVEIVIQIDEIVIFVVEIVVEVVFILVVVLVVVLIILVIILVVEVVVEVEVVVLVVQVLVVEVIILEIVVVVVARRQRQESAAPKSAPNSDISNLSGIAVVSGEGWRESLRR